MSHSQPNSNEFQSTLNAYTTMQSIVLSPLLTRCVQFIFHLSNSNNSALSAKLYTSSETTPSAPFEPKLTKIDDIQLFFRLFLYDVTVGISSASHPHLIAPVPTNQATPNSPHPQQSFGSSLIHNTPSGTSSNINKDRSDRNINPTIHHVVPKSDLLDVFDILHLNYSSFYSSTSTPLSELIHSHKGMLSVSEDNPVLTKHFRNRKSSSFQTNQQYASNPHRNCGPGSATTRGLSSNGTPTQKHDFRSHFYDDQQTSGRFGSILSPQSALTAPNTTLLALSDVYSLSTLTTNLSQITQSITKSHNVSSAQPDSSHTSTPQSLSPNLDCINQLDPLHPSLLPHLYLSQLFFSTLRSTKPTDSISPAQLGNFLSTTETKSNASTLSAQSYTWNRSTTSTQSAAQSYLQPGTPDHNAPNLTGYDPNAFPHGSEKSFDQLVVNWLQQINHFESLAPTQTPTPQTFQGQNYSPNQQSNKPHDQHSVQPENVSQNIQLSLEGAMGFVFSLLLNRQSLLIWRLIVNVYRIISSYQTIIAAIHLTLPHHNSIIASMAHFNGEKLLKSDKSDNNLIKNAQNAVASAQLAQSGAVASGYNDAISHLDQVYASNAIKNHYAINTTVQTSNNDPHSFSSAHLKTNRLFRFVDEDHQHNQLKQLKQQTIKFYSSAPRGSSGSGNNPLNQHLHGPQLNISPPPIHPNSPTHYPNDANTTHNLRRHDPTVPHPTQPLDSIQNDYKVSRILNFAPYLTGNGPLPILSSGLYHYILKNIKATWSKPQLGTQIGPFLTPSAIYNNTPTTADGVALRSTNPNGSMRSNHDSWLDTTSNSSHSGQSTSSPSKSNLIWFRQPTSLYIIAKQHFDRHNTRSILDSILTYYTNFKLHIKMQSKESNPLNSRTTSQSSMSKQLELCFLHSLDGVQFGPYDAAHSQLIFYPKHNGYDYQQNPDWSQQPSQQPYSQSPHILPPGMNLSAAINSDNQYNPSLDNYSLQGKSIRGFKQHNPNSHSLVAKPPQILPGMFFHPFDRNSSDSDADYHYNWPKKTNRSQQLPRYQQQQLSDGASSQKIPPSSQILTKPVTTPLSSAITKPRLNTNIHEYYISQLGFSQFSQHLLNFYSAELSLTHIATLFAKNTGTNHHSQRDTPDTPSQMGKNDPFPAFLDHLTTPLSTIPEHIAEKYGLIPRTTPHSTSIGNNTINNAMVAAPPLYTLLPIANTGTVPKKPQTTQLRADFVTIFDSSSSMLTPYVTQTDILHHSNDLISFSPLGLLTNIGSSITSSRPPTVQRFSGNGENTLISNGKTINNNQPPTSHHTTSPQNTQSSNNSSPPDDLTTINSAQSAHQKLGPHNHQKVKPNHSSAAKSSPNWSTDILPPPQTIIPLHLVPIATMYHLYSGFTQLTSRLKRGEYRIIDGQIIPDLPHPPNRNTLGTSSRQPLTGTFFQDQPSITTSFPLLNNNSSTTQETKNTYNERENYLLSANGTGSVAIISNSQTQKSSYFSNNDPSSYFSSPYTQTLVDNGQNGNFSGQKNGQSDELSPIEVATLLENMLPAYKMALQTYHSLVWAKTPSFDDYHQFIDQHSGIDDGSDDTEQFIKPCYKDSIVISSGNNAQSKYLRQNELDWRGTKYGQTYSNFPSNGSPTGQEIEMSQKDIYFDSIFRRYLALDSFSTAITQFTGGINTNTKTTIEQNLNQPLDFSQYQSLSTTSPTFVSGTNNNTLVSFYFDSILTQKRNQSLAQQKWLRTTHQDLVRERMNNYVHFLKKWFNFGNFEVLDRIDKKLAKIAMVDKLVLKNRPRDEVMAMLLQYSIVPRFKLGDVDQKFASFDHLLDRIDPSDYNMTDNEEQTDSHDDRKEDPGSGIDSSKPDLEQSTTRQTVQNYTLSAPTIGHAYSYLAYPSQFAHIYPLSSNAASHIALFGTSTGQSSPGNGANGTQNDSRASLLDRFASTSDSNQNRPIYSIYSDQTIHRLNFPMPNTLLMGKPAVINKKKQCQNLPDHKVINIQPDPPPPPLPPSDYLDVSTPTTALESSRTAHPNKANNQRPGTKPQTKSFWSKLFPFWSTTVEPRLNYSSPSLAPMFNTEHTIHYGSDKSTEPRDKPIPAPPYSNPFFTAQGLITPQTNDNHFYLSESTISLLTTIFQQCDADSDGLLWGLVPTPLLPIQPDTISVPPPTSNELDDVQNIAIEQSDGILIDQHGQIFTPAISLSHQQPSYPRNSQSRLDTLTPTLSHIATPTFRPIQHQSSNPHFTTPANQFGSLDQLSKQNQQLQQHHTSINTPANTSAILSSTNPIALTPQFPHPKNSPTSVYTSTPQTNGPSNLSIKPHLQPTPDPLVGTPLTTPQLQPLFGDLPDFVLTRNNSFLDTTYSQQQQQPHQHEQHQPTILQCPIPKSFFHGLPISLNPVPTLGRLLNKLTTIFKQYRTQKNIFKSQFGIVFDLPSTPNTNEQFPHMGNCDQNEGEIGNNDLGIDSSEIALILESPYIKQLFLLVSQYNSIAVPSSKHTSTAPQLGLDGVTPIEDILWAKTQCRQFDHIKPLIQTTVNNDLQTTHLDTTPNAPQAQPNATSLKFCNISFAQEFSGQHYDGLPTERKLDIIIELFSTLHSAINLTEPQSGITNQSPILLNILYLLAESTRTLLPVFNTPILQQNEAQLDTLTTILDDPPLLEPNSPHYPQPNPYIQHQPQYISSLAPVLDSFNYGDFDHLNTFTTTTSLPEIHFLLTPLFKAQMSISGFNIHPLQLGSFHTLLDVVLYEPENHGLDNISGIDQSNQSNTDQFQPPSPSTINLPQNDIRLNNSLMFPSSPPQNQPIFGTPTIKHHVTYQNRSHGGNNQRNNPSYTHLDSSNHHSNSNPTDNNLLQLEQYIDAAPIKLSNNTHISPLWSGNDGRQAIGHTDTNSTIDIRPYLNQDLVSLFSQIVSKMTIFTLNLDAWLQYWSLVAAMYPYNFQKLVHDLGMTVVYRMPLIKTGHLLKPNPQQCPISFSNHFKIAINKQVVVRNHYGYHQTDQRSRIDGNYSYTNLKETTPGFIPIPSHNLAIGSDEENSQQSHLQPSSHSTNTTQLPSHTSSRQYEPIRPVVGIVIGWSQTGKSSICKALSQQVNQTKNVQPNDQHDCYENQTDPYQPRSGSYHHLDHTSYIYSASLPRWMPVCVSCVEKDHISSSKKDSGGSTRSQENLASMSFNFNFLHNPLECFHSQSYATHTPARLLRSYPIQLSKLNTVTMMSGDEDASPTTAISPGLESSFIPLYDSRRDQFLSKFDIEFDDNMIISQMMDQTISETLNMDQGATTPPQQSILNHTVIYPNFGSLQSLPPTPPYTNKHNRQEPSLLSSIWNFWSGHKPQQTDIDRQVCTHAHSSTLPIPVPGLHPNYQHNPLLQLPKYIYSIESSLGPEQGVESIPKPVLVDWQRQLFGNTITSLPLTAGAEQHISYPTALNPPLGAVTAQPGQSESHHNINSLNQYFQFQQLILEDFIPTTPNYLPGQNLTLESNTLFLKENKHHILNHQSQQPNNPLPPQPQTASTTGPKTIPVTGYSALVSNPSQNPAQTRLQNIHSTTQMNISTPHPTVINKNNITTNVERGDAFGVSGQHLDIIFDTSILEVTNYINRRLDSNYIHKISQYHGDEPPNSAVEGSDGSITAESSNEKNINNNPHAGGILTTLSHGSTLTYLSNTYYHQSQPLSNRIINKVSQNGQIDLFGPNDNATRNFTSLAPLKLTKYSPFHTTANTLTKLLHQQINPHSQYHFRPFPKAMLSRGGVGVGKRAQPLVSHHNSGSNGLANPYSSHNISNNQTVSRPYSLASALSLDMIIIAVDITSTISILYAVKLLLNLPQRTSIFIFVTHLDLLPVTTPSNLTKPSPIESSPNAHNSTATNENGTTDFNRQTKQSYNSALPTSGEMQSASIDQSAHDPRNTFILHLFSQLLGALQHHDQHLQQQHAPAFHQPNDGQTPLTSPSSPYRSPPATNEEMKSPSALNGLGTVHQVSQQGPGFSSEMNFWSIISDLPHNPELIWSIFQSYTSLVSTILSQHNALFLLALLLPYNITIIPFVPPSPSTNSFMAPINNPHPNNQPSYHPSSLTDVLASYFINPTQLITKHSHDYRQQHHHSPQDETINQHQSPHNKSSNPTPSFNYSTHPPSPVISSTSRAASYKSGLPTPTLRPLNTTTLYGPGDDDGINDGHGSDDHQFQNQPQFDDVVSSQHNQSSETISHHNQSIYSPNSIIHDALTTNTLGNTQPSSTNLDLNHNSSDNLRVTTMYYPTDPMLFSKLTAAALLPQIYSISSSQIYSTPDKQSSLLLNVFKYALYSLLLTSTVSAAFIYTWQRKETLGRIQGQLYTQLALAGRRLKENTDDLIESIETDTLPYLKDQYETTLAHAKESMDNHLGNLKELGTEAWRNTDGAEGFIRNSYPAQTILYLYRTINHYSQHLLPQQNYMANENDANSSSGHDFEGNNGSWYSGLFGLQNQHNLGGPDSSTQGSGYTSYLHPSTWVPISVHFLSLFTNGVTAGPEHRMLSESQLPHQHYHGDSHDIGSMSEGSSADDSDI